MTIDDIAQGNRPDSQPSQRNRRAIFAGIGLSACVLAAGGVLGYFNHNTQVDKTVVNSTKPDVSDAPIDPTPKPVIIKQPNSVIPEKIPNRKPIVKNIVNAIAPIASYDVRVSGPTILGGVTFDGTHLWMSAQSLRSPDLFLQYSLDGEFQQNIISDHDGNPAGGLAFDGKSLYSLNYTTNMKTGRGTIDKFSLEGKFLDAQPSNGSRNTFGIVYNGSGFYQAHSPSMARNSTIYTLDADLKETKKNSVKFYVRGLAWDGENLWVSSKNKRIHRLKQDFSIDQTFSTPVQIQDITWADKRLYGTQTNSTMFHEFDIQK